MAKHFRSCLENVHDEVYRNRIYAMLPSWISLNDDDAKLVKNYVWVCVGTELQKMGITKDGMKMSVEKTSSRWSSERDVEMYAVAFLKPDGTTTGFSFYEGMKTSDLDHPFKARMMTR